jgi:hypothetical protein
MTAIGNATVLEQPGLKSTEITIHNSRNCDYRSETDYANCWSERQSFFKQLKEREKMVVLPCVALNGWPASGRSSFARERRSQLYQTDPWLDCCFAFSTSVLSSSRIARTRNSRLSCSAFAAREWLLWLR